MENVAIVNEAFVRRFFKSEEDPLNQYFGLDLPENVGTYRIVGIVRDAKFAGGAGSTTRSCLPTDLPRVFRTA